MSNPTPRNRKVTDPVLRFERKFALDAATGCWVWTSTLYPNGYGSFAIRLPGDEKKWGRKYAHRFSYETYVGKIPEGLHIDHLCRNRACVNPAHLEPVTRQENMRRGRSANREKTHCPRGHEYTPENTYVERANGRNGRKCVICTKESAKLSYLRRKTLEHAA